jgi:hypothetical protein
MLPNDNIKKYHYTSLACLSSVDEQKTDNDSLRATNYHTEPLIDSTTFDHFTSICSKNMTFKEDDRLRIEVNTDNKTIQHKTAASLLSISNRFSLKHLKTRSDRCQFLRSHQTKQQKSKLDKYSCSKSKRITKLKGLNKLSSFTLNLALKAENKRIRINVGGVRFETYRPTLMLIRESRLANLSPTNSDYDPIRDEYFFDRDPISFQAILNYYRTGRLHAPGSVCGNLFFQELEFWNISEQSIQPCCWTAYNNNRECDEILKKVMGELEQESNY